MQNNTIIHTSNADSAITLDCEGGWDTCTNANSIFQNNITLGYSDGLNPNADAEDPALIYLLHPDLVNQSYFSSTAMPPHNGWQTRNHNMFYTVRSGWCPTPLQTAETCDTSSPMFIGQPSSPISAESVLDNFNFKPATGSPAIGAGVAIPGLTTDYTGATRPNPPSLGAVE